jgi:hypothetical protein
MSEALMHGMSVREFYDCTPKDVHVFLVAKHKKVGFDLEQGWDYTRNIMLPSMMQVSTKYSRPQDIMRLKRDGRAMTELTPEEQAKLDDWAKKCDEEMMAEGKTIV